MLLYKKKCCIIICSSSSSNPAADFFLEDCCNMFVYYYNNRALCLSEYISFLVWLHLSSSTPFPVPMLFECVWIPCFGYFLGIFSRFPLLPFLTSYHNRLCIHHVHVSLLHSVILGVRALASSSTFDVSLESSMK